MKKQSSVEWLVEKIQQANPLFKFDALKRQAKAMHREEIENSWENGNHQEMRGGKYLKPLSSKYYNETFGNNTP
jgi:hypothetical protein